MDEPADTTEGKIDSLDGDIILRDVTYKYPGSDSQPVIGGLDLTIPRGKPPPSSVRADAANRP